MKSLLFAKFRFGLTRLLIHHFSFNPISRRLISQRKCGELLFTRPSSTEQRGDQLFQYPTVHWILQGMQLSFFVLPILKSITMFWRCGGSVKHGNFVACGWNNRVSSFLKYFLISAFLSPCIGLLNPIVRFTKFVVGLSPLKNQRQWGGSTTWLDQFSLKHGEALPHCVMRYEDKDIHPHSTKRRPASLSVLSPGSNVVGVKIVGTVQWIQEILCSMSQAHGGQRFEVMKFLLEVY